MCALAAALTALLEGRVDVLLLPRLEWLLLEAVAREYPGPSHAWLRDDAQPSGPPQEDTLYELQKVRAQRSQRTRPQSV